MIRVASTCAGLAVSLAACSLGGSRTPEAIVLYVASALPAEAIGCYGDPSARTPDWDRLARRGVSFRHATIGEDDLLSDVLTGGSPRTTWTEGQKTDPAQLGIPTVENALAVAGVRKLKTAEDLESEDALFAIRTVDWEPPAGIPGRALGNTLRTLAGRLERGMIVAAASSPDPESGAPIALVIWGPWPFSGGMIREDAAHPVDLYPTILSAFSIGPDHRLRGQRLQEVKEPDGSDEMSLS